VLDGGSTPGIGEPALLTGAAASGADEVADYRSEDSSEDLPPAAQTPVVRDVAAVVESPEGSPDGPPVEPAVVETGPADAPEETKATGRPRRRRAASRPAGPPV
jgi:ribonuclease E